MEHKVLARKLRPKRFDMLVGQLNTVKILKKIINSNKIHHAILLTGTRGVGKTTIARIIARALNCINLIDGEPCTQCSNCKQIEAGSYIDVIEIDAASNTGVENVRELIENAQYAPIEGRYKIYIIDEVHMLSKSAFNAMLKTLEEPPEFVVFILATTDLIKIPATILSRCLQLKLRDLLSTEISAYLRQVLENENIQSEPNAINILAKAARGSMRDALSLLDQAIAFSEENISELVVTNMLGLTSDDFIYSILNFIAIKDGTALINEVEKNISEGKDPELILASIQSKLTEISICQITGKSNNQNIVNLAKIISVNDIQLFYEITNIGLSQFNQSSDKYSVFLMAILRMMSFMIGSSNEKNLIISETNYNVSTIINDNNHNKDLQQNIINKSQQENATDNIKINQISTKPNPIEKDNEPNLKSEMIISSNEDWLNFLITNEISLGHIFPILKNSNYISSEKETKTINLVVDLRYKGAVNNEIMLQINQKFCEILNQNISINYEFSEELSGTLEKKNIEISKINQSHIDDMIKSDKYLVELMNRFSGIIMPGSIKSIN